MWSSVHIPGILDRARGATIVADHEPPELPPSIDEHSGSEAHKGLGEDIAPAVWPEEWTFRVDDQLSRAADVDDPVEALEVGALGAAAET